MEKTTSAELTVARQQEVTALADETGRKPSDLHPAVATLLRSKRWKKREEPFQGFGSPEGKF